MPTCVSLTSLASSFLIGTLRAIFTSELIFKNLTSPKPPGTVVLLALPSVVLVVCGGGLPVWTGQPPYFERQLLARSPSRAKWPSCGQHVAPTKDDWTAASAKQQCSELLPVCLKGKLGNFFLLAQRFYWAQTKRSLNRQFWPKSPKVGQKKGQSVKNWPNKTPFASDLLWESTNSVIGAAVGIHLIELYTHMDSHSSSDEGIGGFPQ